MIYKQHPYQQAEWYTQWLEVQKRRDRRFYAALAVLNLIGLVIALPIVAAYLGGGAAGQIVSGAFGAVIAIGALYGATWWSRR